MKKLSRLIAVIAVAGLAMANTACNDEGMKSINGNFATGSNGSAGAGPITAPVSDDGEVDMSKLDAELDVVEDEMAKLDAQLSALNVAGLGNSSSGAQTGLDKTLRTIFEKLLGGIDKAREKVDEIKAKVQERINKLDPTNPLHLVAIAKLQEAMTYLDDVGGKLDEQILKLVEVIDSAVSRVDRAVASISNEIARIAAMFLWEPIKLVIFEYRDKLMVAAGG